ncbi:2906_t:CDS:10 [Ambispora gerdemannii]|uniref:2906_t:CDS:1 n=1 Tax=Ambispora gerdemannii TaxID=144530 RepID=A0A9N8WFY7_9GLOM|nr:2906_t:CDS:10 [Ambispora gerdemannii]
MNSNTAATTSSASLAFTFEAENFRKIQPKEFIKKFLEQNVRPDGRVFRQFRKTTVNSGHISTADGSAVVRIGNTTVVCGIKAEVAEPKTSTPKEGYLVPNIELSPICSSKVKPGPPSEHAQVMSENLNKLLKSSSVISLKDLCIEEGKAVWVLYADIICINYDGNVFDASVIAIIAALNNLRLRKVEYNEGLVTATETRPIKLNLSRLPLSSTFALFDGLYLLADPSDAEESVMEEMVTVVCDETGKLCNIWKRGGPSCSPDQIITCVSLARERYTTIYDTVNYSNNKVVAEVADQDAMKHKAVQFESEEAKMNERTATSVARKKPILTRIKDELVHYWDGTKLLGLEIRISTKLLFKLLRGQTLTRREDRQLRRTTQDLVRLVPFAVFIIVPFMEFLLPVALKLFPNMLPSTFEDKFSKEEKKRKILKVRLEMAKFLQETIEEIGASGSGREEAAKEFSEFFRKVRSTGEQASTEDLLRIANLFEDELTLDNLSRPQLVSMCRYMGINAFGTDNFLRYQIRNSMKSIKEDDKMIRAEGIDSLTIPELHAASQSRGIRTIGVSPARLRNELNQWLDLHLNHKVPSSLLILSRAFSFADRSELVDQAQALQATLDSLPDNLVNEAELEVSEASATYKQKLEVIEQQEELIADEKAQEEKEEAARRAHKEQIEAERRAQKEAEELAKEATFAEDLAPNKKITFVAEDDARMTQQQLQELREALTILSSKSAVLEEREVLKEIRDDHEEYKEDMHIEAGGKESKASLRLGERLEKMIQKIDSELEQYDSEVGSRLNLIQANESGQITVSALEEALRVIKHTPGDNERIKKIVKKLDVDSDGLVFLDHISELCVKGEGMGVLVESEKEKTEKTTAKKKPKKEDILRED